MHPTQRVKALDAAIYQARRAYAARPQGQQTESTAGLGAFPEIGLSKAREKAREARADVALGIHPKSGRRARKASNVQAEAATLKVIADEWLAHNKADWSTHHYERNDGYRRILLPQLGALPIREITEPMLLTVLRKSYDGGTRESARRARAVAAQVFRFAMDSKRTDTNPALALASSTVLKKPEVKNFAALKAGEVGPMLRALAVSGTELATKAAILLMLLTGLRDAALRGARWSEVDLQSSTWTVPANRMKSGRVHKVPLPRQAVATLEQLSKLTLRGPASFVFASTSKAGYLAENSLRLALHRLGFKVTVHGFRSLLTDLLNTRGFNADAIERQLDHVQRDKVRAVFPHGLF